MSYGLLGLFIIVTLICGVKASWGLLKIIGFIVFFPIIFLIAVAFGLSVIAFIALFILFVYELLSFFFWW